MFKFFGIALLLTFFATFTAFHRLTLAPMAADLTLVAFSFAKCPTIHFVNCLIRGANSMVHLFLSSFNNLFLRFILFFISGGMVFTFVFKFWSTYFSGESSSMIFNKMFYKQFQCSCTFKLCQLKFTDSGESWSFRFSLILQKKFQFRFKTKFGGVTSFMFSSTCISKWSK